MLAMCVVTSTDPPALVNPGVAITSCTARNVLRAVMVPYAVCVLPETPLIDAFSENWNAVPVDGVITTPGLLSAPFTGMDAPGARVTLEVFSEPVTPPGSDPRLRLYVLVVVELFCRTTRKFVGEAGSATAEFGCSAKLNGNAAGEVSTVERLARSALSCVSAAPIFAHVAAEIADTSA